MNTGAFKLNYPKDIPSEAIGARTREISHALNEWADLGSNALQWLHNVAEGISSADDVLHEMKENYDRVLKLSRAADAILSLSGPTREETIAECLAAMPCTAENPNEDSYQRGRFDGILDYQRAIRTLASAPALSRPERS